MNQSTIVDGGGSFSVSLPEAVFDPQYLRPLGLRIEQSVRLHDMATIRFRSRFVDWKSVLAPGTPVSITWKSKFSSNRSFYGYVSYVKPAMTRTKYHDFDVVVSGASKILRATSQRVWRDKSVSEIVSEVARDFKLNPVVEPHSLRRSTTTMKGESYWEFLSRITGPIGFGLWADGVNLYAGSISSLARDQFDGAPVVTSFGLAGVDKESLGYTIGMESFTTSAGLATESGMYTGDPAKAYAMNPAGGPESVAQARPGSATKRNRKTSSPNVRIVSGRVSHSRSEADALARGVAENGLLAIDGSLSCGGSPLLRPYAPVYLDLYNAATSGWWIVKSVIHEFSADKRGQYTCRCVVSTDSLSESTDDGPQGSVRRVSPEAIVGQQRLRGRYREPVLRRTKTVPVEGKTDGLVGAFRWVAV